MRRRRTVRRSALAAVLVLLLAIPAALLLRGGGSPPVIGPTVPPDSPTPSVSPQMETRKVDLGGVTFPERPLIYFLDGQNGWLHHALVLASTVDAGRTWRLAAVPELPGGATFTPFFLDGQTVTVQVTEEHMDIPSHYLLSKDRGQTWTSYPLRQPPVEGQLVHGRFQLRCPGATGFEDGAWGVSCFQPELVKTGSGPVATPSWFDSTLSLMTGEDGRIWLVSDERVAVSSDEAKTWRQLPAPPPVEQGRYELSLDGKQLFHLGETKIWELSGEQWAERMTVPELAADDAWASYLSDGLWLVTRRSGMAYLQDGVLTPIPELVDPRGGGLRRDGTLVIYAENGVYLGYGKGRERQWVLVQQ